MTKNQPTFKIHKNYKSNDDKSYCLFLKRKDYNSLINRFFKFYNDFRLEPRTQSHRRWDDNWRISRGVQRQDYPELRQGANQAIVRQVPKS